MKKSQGDSGFLTNEQLHGELESLTGIRPPSGHGANWRAEFAEYEVVSGFTFCMKHAASPEIAARDAVAMLFAGSACQIEELIPHIERALGRVMTPAEREAGALAA